MGIATTLHGRVLATLEAACAGEDWRRVRSLGWLVTGNLLEQDARLGRIALAQVLLVSMATRLLLNDTAASVDPHGEGVLSLLQLGARYLRSEVWQGRTPRLGICLLPDEMMEGGADDERRQLRALYHRLGLVPGEQWIPPGSFEERNRMWWLPGNIKRYMPRLPLGDPPMIWGRRKG